MKIALSLALAVLPLVASADVLVPGKPPGQYGGGPPKPIKPDGTTIAGRKDTGPHKSNKKALDPQPAQEQNAAVATTTQTTTVEPAKKPAGAQQAPLQPFEATPKRAGLPVFPLLSISLLGAVAVALLFARRRRRAQ